MINYSMLIKTKYFRNFLIQLLLFIFPLILYMVGIRDITITATFFFMGSLWIPYGIMSEISGSNYILISTLPIKIKDAIKISYIRAYLIAAVGFVFSLIITIFGYSQLSMKYMLYSALFLLCINIFFPCFASEELKLGVNQTFKVSMWIILDFCMAVFIGTFLQGLGNLAPKIIISVEIIIIGIVILIAIFTVKKSYEYTFKKIMNL